VKVLTQIALAILVLCSPNYSFSQSTNRLDILLEAYEKDKPSKNVTYRLLRGEKEVAKTTSKKGEFNFIIRKDDPILQLYVSKPGYLTKRIFFDPKEYPFEVEFETQEIAIHCVPATPDLKGFTYTGNLEYDPIGKVYQVNRIDSLTADLRQRIQKGEAQVQAIYEKAVYNGDGLMKIEEYEYAKGYYEMALIAKPDDGYAKERLTYSDSMAIVERNKPKPVPTTLIVDAGKPEAANSGENNTDEPTASASNTNIESVATTPSTTDAYYSVQLGAFVDWYDQSVFEDVPELMVVQGSDYKRCITGQFEQREEAIARAKVMKERGFKDAFVVQMKGNQRIGF